MGVTKNELFSEEQNLIALFAKAFAHPARVAILQCLMARGTCICAEIVDGLPLSQATVSQHLKELKDIGIIKGEIDPPRVCYCIDQVVWGRVQGVFAQLFGQMQSASCCS